jgi:uncharacterized cupredoxin-like copper-binding protein
MALPFILLAFFGAYIRFVALHPEWFFDFTSAWLLLTGMGLILTGSIASLAEARRGRARLRAPAAGKIALGVIGGVLLVLAGGSALLTASQAKRGSSETEAGVVTVYFEGGRLRQELPPSAGEVSFLLQNKDLLVHSFTVRPMRVDCRTDEFGRRQCDTIYGDDVADVAVGPGSERMVTIQLNPGDYEVRCRVPGHSDLLRGWHLE